MWPCLAVTKRTHTSHIHRILWREYESVENDHMSQLCLREPYVPVSLLVDVDIGFAHAYRHVHHSDNIYGNYYYLCISLLICRSLFYSIERYATEYIVCVATLGAIDSTTNVLPSFNMYAYTYSIYTCAIFAQMRNRKIRPGAEENKKEEKSQEYGSIVG